jgi:hypothetical protein
MTRQRRAEDLLARLRRGPVLHGGKILMTGQRGMTSNDAEWQVQMWLTTSVIKDVIELVPELKDRRVR